MPSRPHFRLLDLPEELILRILHFAVVQGTPQNPIKIDQEIRHPLCHPAIIRTCHLLHREGIKIFYKENVFHVVGDWEGSSGLRAWMNSLPSEHIPLIENLYCNWFTCAKPVETARFGYFVGGIGRLNMKMPKEWTVYVKRNEKHQILLPESGEIKFCCRIRVVKDAAMSLSEDEWFDSRKVKELPFDMDTRSGWWVYEEES